MMSEAIEITASLDPPFRDRLSKDKLWRETIAVWDLLVDNNYRPADFGCGTVTMRGPGFKKFIKDHTKGSAATQETRQYRLNSVWVGNVEICLTEIKSQNSKWAIVDDWVPLESYDE